MSTRHVIDKYQGRQGWSDATVLDLLIGYLDNQGSDDALYDYLREVAAEENSASVEWPEAGDECDDVAACVASACPEHPAHRGPDHTHEQHHAPRDHAGAGPCRCTAYLPPEPERSAEDDCD
jgi:hypothetical protein